MKKNLEVCALAFAVQDTKPEEDSFTGMASVFNVLIDTWIPTRILPGAFTKTLQENAKRIKICYQHNQDWPIGTPIRLEENADGLFVEGKISQTVVGRDALTLLRDKVLTELSIGFDPIKHMMVEEPGIGMCRHIMELRLWEVSLVTFGANRRSTVLAVHSLFDVVCAGGPDFSVGEEANKYLRAVFDRLRVLPVGDCEPAQVMHLAVLQLMELHAGKVLSAKNRQLVQDAIEALEKLVEAAEPPQNKPATLTDLNERLRVLSVSYLDAACRHHAGGAQS